MNKPLRYEDGDENLSAESAPLEASTDVFLNNGAPGDGAEESAGLDELDASLDDSFADRPAPRITIEAFVELAETRRLIEASAQDRRLARTHIEIFDNGLPVAIERYHDNATPNLVIIESGMRGRGLFEQLDELASVCDPDTKVVVIGAANDIALYRELLKRGVSEYLVPPVTPMQFMRTISGLYTDPEAPFQSKSARQGITCSRPMSRR